MSRLGNGRTTLSVGRRRASFGAFLWRTLTDSPDELAVVVSQGSQLLARVFYPSLCRLFELHKRAGPESL